MLAITQIPTNALANAPQFATALGGPNSRFLSFSGFPIRKNPSNSYSLGPALHGCKCTTFTNVHAPFPASHRSRAKNHLQQWFLCYQDPRFGNPHRLLFAKSGNISRKFFERFDEKSVLTWLLYRPGFRVRSLCTYCCFRR